MAMPVAFGLPTVRLTVGRLKVAAGVLAVGITVAAAGGSLARITANDGASAPVSAAGNLASAPAALQSAVQATLGAHAAQYAVTHRGDTLATSGGGISATFGSTGPIVRAGGKTLGLSFSGIGYGTQLAQPGHVAPVANANEVLYRHAGVTEWYRNGPLGLEQGFTLQQRPAGSTASGPLTIALRTSGAALSQHGVTIRIAGTSASYGGLTAFDAVGHKLPSTLVLQHGTLLLQVKDAGARYPLTIDPLVSGYGRMNASGDITTGVPVGSGAVGTSVSLSADGKEALVGAPADDGGIGAAWVFLMTGNGAWDSGYKLTSGDADAGAFGSSVSLSSNGSKALVGAPNDTNTGAAWAFTISVGTTTDPSNPFVVSANRDYKFTGAGQDNSNDPTGARYGAAVALSGDGQTALIGAYKDYVTGPPATNPGSVWAYTLDSNTVTWTAQGSKFTGTGGNAAFVSFGAAIALSDDGNTAVVGGPSAGSGPGAAWIFTRLNGIWSQQGLKLAPNDGSGSGHFGTSVALSSDGNTALIGAPNDAGDIGAAWAFTRSGTTWSQQGPKLLGDDENGAAQFGTSVALSSTGDTALVGGPRDQYDTGAAWLYVRSNSAWAEQGTRLTAGSFGGGSGGTSVALSADGLRSTLGSPVADAGSGAVLSFQVTTPAVPTTITAEAYDGMAEVQITSDDSAFTSYTVTASPGGATTTGGAMADGDTWLNVMGLTNGVEYTFTVTATNQAGTSNPSTPSNAVTPVAAPVVEPTPEPDPAPAPTPAPAPEPTPAPAPAPAPVVAPVVVKQPVSTPLITPTEQKAINVAQTAVTADRTAVVKALAEAAAAKQSVIANRKKALAAVTAVAAPSATATQKSHVVSTATKLVDVKASSAKLIAAAKAAAAKAEAAKNAAAAAAKAEAAKQEAARKAFVSGKLTARQLATQTQLAADAKTLAAKKAAADAAAAAKQTAAEAAAVKNIAGADKKVDTALTVVSAGTATPSDKKHVVAAIRHLVAAQTIAADKADAAKASAEKLAAAKKKLAATKAAAVKP